MQAFGEILREILIKLHDRSICTIMRIMRSFTKVPTLTGGDEPDAVVQDIAQRRIEAVFSRFFDSLKLTGIDFPLACAVMR